MSIISYTTAKLASFPVLVHKENPELRLLPNMVMIDITLTYS